MDSDDNGIKRAETFKVWFEKGRVYMTNVVTGERCVPEGIAYT